MDSKIFLLLLVATLVASDCTLEKLYKDSHRQMVVKELLTSLFEHQFSLVLQESHDKAPFLVPPAVHFKRDLRKLFVEYGHNFSTYEDLDIELKGLKYIEVPLFKAYREDFEQLKDNGFNTST